MTVLMGSYWIDVFDSDGDRVAVLDDWRLLNYGHTINGSHAWALSLDGEDERTALFEAEGLVRIYRYIPGFLEAYKEYEGMIEDFQDALLESGNREFRVGGGDPNSLLKRRHVLWAASSAQTEKNDAAETVMKEYVDENLGPGALAVDGRDLDGYDTRVSVSPDNGLGPNWEGQRTRRELFSVIQSIAQFAYEQDDSIDFEMTPTDVLEWTFQVYDQIGTDRSYDTIDPATGLNAAGNRPLILSRKRGNIASGTYSRKHSTERNAVVALGSGVGAGREVVTATNAAAIALCGQRESTRSANTSSSNQLQALADSEIAEKSNSELVEVEPLRTPNLLYGLHYEAGDTITVLWEEPDGTETRHHKRLMGISVSVSAGKESFSFNFKDL